MPKGAVTLSSRGQAPSVVPHQHCSLKPGKGICIATAA